MKQILYILILFSTLPVLAQYTLVPDAAFEQYLIGGGHDSENILDGRVLTSDMQQIEILDLAYNTTIHDITGIQDCSSLWVLHTENSNITAGWNFSNCTALEYLYINYFPSDTDDIMVQSLDLTNNINLKELYASGVQLQSVTFGANTNLETVEVSWNPLDNGIDTSSLTNLKIFTAYQSRLTQVDFSNNLVLEELYLYGGNLAAYSGNWLITIDLTHNSLLKKLHLGISRPLSIGPIAIDLSQNSALIELELIGNIDFLNVANGNNVNITSFSFIRGGLLPACVQVDLQAIADAANADTNSWQESDGVVYGITSDCSTANVDLVNTRELKIYPNPSTGVFTVSTGSSAIAKIVCYNYLGQQIAVFTSNTFDLSALENGLYLLEVTTDTHEVFTKKVLKR